MDWDLYERIGKGSYGAVYRGVHVRTGEEVAVKIVDLEEAEDEVNEIQQEIAVLSQSRSPHVTRYIGSRLIEGTAKLCIVMEYMAGGSVADLVQLGGPLDETSAKYVVHELCLALEYLHGEHKIHRDIKAANVLLTASGEVRLADFGVSGTMSHTMGARRKTFAGTPFWMAPEVITQQEAGYNEKADIWSLGITLFEMATGKPPHAEEHPMRVLFVIPKTPPPALPPGAQWSRALRDLVAFILVKEPAGRPSARELLRHRTLRDVRAPGPSFPERMRQRLLLRASQRRDAPAAPAEEAAAFLLEEASGAGEEESGAGSTWDFGRAPRHQTASAAMAFEAALAAGGTVRMPAGIPRVASAAALERAEEEEEGQPMSPAARPESPGTQPPSPAREPSPADSAPAGDAEAEEEGAEREPPAPPPAPPSPPPQAEPEFDAGNVLLQYALRLAAAPGGPASEGDALEPAAATPLHAWMLARWREDVAAAVLGS